jgi:DNA-cytosine methyltransferase
MRVVSLFDGMSCAQQALNRLGIKYEAYYASEIDKHAIKVTQANYPNTIQVGDVTLLDTEQFPLIDLLVGGSPCQGFSFAGKGLNFEDPRSKLFFEFVRVLKELQKINPKIKFLLENVRMKKEHQDIISKHLGVEPIKINSALVSAQNRVRLYWTNIEGVTQPKDKGILLKDIIESGATERDKSLCIDANYFKGGSLKNYLEKRRRQLVFQINPDISAGGKQPRMQDRIYLDQGKSVSLTQFAGRTNVGFSQSENRLSMVYEKPHGFCSGGFKEVDKFQTLREHTKNNYAIHDEIKFRKLSVIECERLQTVKDGYTSSASNSQAYKMLGNGMTIDIIAHIFSFMNLEANLTQSCEGEM